MEYLHHTVQKDAALCASSLSSSSEGGVELSWKPRESSAQTPACEQSEGCTGRGLLGRERAGGSLTHKTCKVFYFNGNFQAEVFGEEAEQRSALITPMQLKLCCVVFVL